MRIQASRNRQLAAGVILIWVSVSIAVEPETADEEGGGQLAKVPTYDEIPGLSVTGHSNTMMGKSKESCLRICSGEPSCKSVSYRKSDETCVVSRDALTYNPDFEFHAKSMDLAKRGQYETFDGLTYGDNGWVKGKPGLKKQECQTLCDKAGVNCKAYTYREHDRTCLLSEMGIKYDLDFTYCEKNDPALDPVDTVSVFPAPPPPHEVFKASGANAGVSALEILEKKKADYAKREQAKAKADAKQALIDIDKMKNETATAVEEAKEQSEKALEKMEEEFKANAKENMGKMKDRAKIKFAEHEVVEKAREKRQRLYREKERAKKQIAKILLDGQKKVDRAAVKAKGAAFVEARKLRVTNEIQAVRNKMNFAASREARTKHVEDEDRQQRNLITERESKAENIATMEMQKKQATMLASLEVRQKKTAVETKATVVKIDEQSNKHLKELETKEMNRRTERGVKIKAKAQTIELGAKKVADEASQKRQADNLAQIARDDRLRQLQSQILDENKRRDEAQGMVEIAGKKMTHEGEVEVRRMLQKMKMSEVAGKELNSKKILAVKEDMQKRLRGAQRETKQKQAKLVARIAVTSMKKTEPDRNITRLSTNQASDEYQNVSASWEIEKPYLKEERRDAGINGEAAVKETKEWRRKQVKFAKMAARETVHKANEEKRNIEAMGAAQGDTIRAAGRERAQKIPGERLEEEKAIVGMVKRVVKCDVGAYVDSGPTPLIGGLPSGPKAGLDSPKFHKAMISDKIEWMQAQSLMDEEAEEYHATEKRTKIRLVDAAKQFEADNNASLASLLQVQNETATAKAEADQAISDMALASPSSITLQMNQIRDNSPYTNFLTVPVLNQSRELGEEMYGGQLRNDMDVSDLSDIGSIELVDDDGNVELVELDEDTGVTFVASDLAFVANGKKCAGSVTNSFTLDQCKDQAVSSNKAHMAYNSAASQCVTEATCTEQTVSGWALYEAPTSGPTPTPTTLPPTTPAPTPPPTYNASDPVTKNAIRQDQLQINELAEKNQDRVLLMRKKTAADGRDAQAMSAYQAALNATQREYDTTVDRVNNILEIRYNTSINANNTFEHATVVLDWAKGNYSNSMDNPANTAFGKLPEQTSKAGVLRLQTGRKKEQMAYLQFPVDNLADNKVILVAHLKMHKLSGEGGPVTVYAASCQWSRDTLTYVKAQNMPYARVSRGINAKIPEAENVWTNIELKPDVVQNARLAGAHICMAVKGGPSDTFAEMSSELSDFPPELVIETATTNPESFKRRPVTKPKKLKSAADYCKEKIRNEIKAEKAKGRLKYNRNEAAQKIQKLKKAEGGTNAATDVMDVMELQADSAMEEGQAMAQQASAIQASAQKIAATQLTAMASRGASIEEIQVATASMQQQAGEQASQAARTVGQKIATEGQTGLAKAEEKLEQESTIRKMKLDMKIESIRAKGETLTESQAAQVDADVETAYAKRESECLAFATPEAEAAAGAATVLDDEVQLIE